MSVDPKIPTARDIAVAIIREKNEHAEDIWNAYLLNFKEETIEGVLVSSRGYGEKEGKKVETSMLRHFLDTLPPNSFARIEPIMEDLFGIANEFWVSFYLHRVMYDKKYVFVAESIKEENFIDIPLINKKGVLIK